MVWLFYIIPAALTKNIISVGQVEFLIWGFVVNKEKDNWYTRAWSKWAAVGLTNCIIFADKKYQDGHIRTHELRHCRQQWAFGPLFYLLYGLSSAYLLLFTKKHIYLDNVFERDARNSAGELVDVPPERWPDGPNDRNPWW